MKNLEYLLYVKNILHLFKHSPYFLLTLKIKNTKINFLSKKLIKNHKLLLGLTSCTILKYPLYFLTFKTSNELYLYIKNLKQKSIVLYININYIKFYATLKTLFFINPIIIFLNFKMLVTSASFLFKFKLNF